MEIPEPFRSSKEYVNLGIIGEGGNGCCFLLSTKDRTRFYVLKVAKYGSLVKEGRNMCEISIPYFSKAYDYTRDEESKEQWILMDYIPGVGLNEFIPNNRIEEIKPLYFFKICIHIAYTLDKLHKTDKIHRDIKSENIIIDGDFNPHIIDLGDIGKKEKNSNFLKTGRIHGTIPFSAPEVFLHIPCLQSDVFSFGATMFQMITGQYPFQDLYLTTEGVLKYKKIVEKNPQFGDDIEEIEDYFETLFENVTAFEKSVDDDEKNELFSKICNGAGEIIKKIVVKGYVDDRYKEGELHEKLSDRNKEIMKLVYNCFIYDPRSRPTPEEIIDSLLKTANSYMDESSYSELEEHIAMIDDTQSEAFGTVQYVQKAVENNLDALSNTLQEVASYCIPDYEPSSEEDTQKVYNILTNFHQ